MEITKRWSLMTPEEKAIARAEEKARADAFNAARRSAQAAARGRAGAAKRAVIARNVAAGAEKARIEAERIEAERVARAEFVRAEYAAYVADQARRAEADRLRALAEREARETAEWAAMSHAERVEASDEVSQVSPEARRFLRAI